MRRETFLSVMVGVMTLAATAAGQEPYGASETAVYRVQYGPSHLAQMAVEVSCEQDGVVRATLSAASRGLARRVHPFQVRLDTAALVVEGRSEQGQTFIHEKGEGRRYQSLFDGGRPSVATRWSRRGGEGREQVVLPGVGNDLLSWMLHLRYDLAREGGLSQARRYALWDGWKLVYLDVTPGAVEDLWTPAGAGEAQAFILRRTRLYHEGERLFEAQDDAEDLGTIWLATTEAATPMAMSFRAPIGRVRIELESLERRACGE